MKKSSTMENEEVKYNACTPEEPEELVVANPSQKVTGSSQRSESVL